MAEPSEDVVATGLGTLRVEAMAETRTQDSWGDADVTVRTDPTAARTELTLGGPPEDIARVRIRERSGPDGPGLTVCVPYHPDPTADYAGSPVDDGDRPRVSVRVVAPAVAHVEADLRRADVDLRGDFGSADVRVLRGSLHIEGDVGSVAAAVIDGEGVDVDRVTGTANIFTSNCRLRVGDARPTGTAELRSSVGNVEVGNADPQGAQGKLVLATAADIHYVAASQEAKARIEVSAGGRIAVATRPPASARPAVRRAEQREGPSRVPQHRQR